MLVGTGIAGVLSGASADQLREWSRTRGPARFPRGVITRCSSSAWSFEEVLIARALSRLSAEKSTQAARKALDAWADRIEAERREGTLPETIEIILGVPMLRLPFENARGELVPDLHHPRPFVEIDTAIRGGYPVVEGTRIPFDVVGELIEDGCSTAEIGRFFPVTAEAAYDAHELYIAAHCVNSPVLRMRWNGRR